MHDQLVIHAVTIPLNQAIYTQSQQCRDRSQLASGSMEHNGGDGFLCLFCDSDRTVDLCVWMCVLFGWVLLFK